MLSDDNYKEFVEFAMNYLIYGYSFSSSSDFENYMNTVETRETVITNGFDLVDNEFNTYKINKNATYSIFKYFDYFEPIQEENVLYLSYTLLNMFSGQNLTQSDWEAKFINGATFTYYDAFGNSYTRNVKIKISGKNDSSIRIFASKDLIEHMFSDTLSPYGAAVSDKEEGLNIYKKYKNDGMSIISAEFQSAETVFTLTSTYKNLFTFIGVLLFAAGFIVIFYMGYECVKRKQYEIGILKSMGIALLDLYRLYFVNFIVEILLCGGFCALFIKFFKDQANSILINSIFKVSDSLRNVKFEIFTITPSVLITSAVVILVSLICGVIIPFYKILFIEPIDIIKANRS